MRNKVGVLFPAIHGRVITSSSSAAFILCANIAVTASDWSVKTSSSRNASVTCASIVIIADSGGIDGLIDTVSSVHVAIICGTLVVVVTVLGSEDARVLLSIACVDGAFVVVVANFGCGSACSIAAGIAFVLGAVDVRASDGSSGIVTDLRAVGNVGECASSLRIASIGGAWRLIDACNLGIVASNSGIASIGGANVVVVAVDGGVEASSIGIASVVGASIRVIAADGWEVTSVSVDSIGASIVSASVSIITEIGAEASLSTAAISETSGSTGISWNVGAGSSDKSVKDSGKSGERISVESGLNSGKIGSNFVDLSLTD